MTGAILFQYKTKQSVCPLSPADTVPDGSIRSFPVSAGENQVCDAGVFLPAFIHHFESVWRCLPIATKELQINEQIRDSEVRLIGSDGEQLGVVPTREAQRLADEKELDLVKIAPTATPPVCRIMDYGKYRFEQSKREKGSAEKPAYRGAQGGPPVP